MIHCILVQSVHFPDSLEINSSDQQFLEAVMPSKTVDQTVEMIKATRKRDLTDWNLAEHYEPKILIQVGWHFSLRRHSFNEGLNLMF